jgi:hypothetical protein
MSFRQLRVCNFVAPSLTRGRICKLLYNSVRVRVRVILQLTVSQSVYLGVEPDLGLLTRDIFFLFESHCPVIWGRPLWREVGSVFCQSLELEFFLRPTVSWPVRLGIGPPFGTLDQILSCSSYFADNYFSLLSKAPSLTRKRVCSL